jgi:hypothetical protein
VAQNRERPVDAAVSGRPVGGDLAASRPALYSLMLATVISASGVSAPNAAFSCWTVTGGATSVSLLRWVSISTIQPGLDFGEALPTSRPSSAVRPRLLERSAAIASIMPGRSSSASDGFTSRSALASSASASSWVHSAL